eukprot:CAMPEP_0202920300 /NCGR_PEP_ID=MMETSP1392-20130828/76785_1 /ASSEMBLY_ACC=CAM_ASM_000868 /TAXON_ID=225041 /ORGANISM="Chlamydomonas chlamydogama, Strain SAG 11-48b" /LENGTH=76 /DNA_ID=CAMNT_0049613787 /DNA_START=1135 /DNA_END=1365 /DNA_ORIENTATION=+
MYPSACGMVGCVSVISGQLVDKALPSFVEACSFEVLMLAVYEPDPMLGYKPPMHARGDAINQYMPCGWGGEVHSKA